MNVELRDFKDGIVTLYFERTQGKHNSVSLDIPIDRVGLTKNQSVTLAYHNIRPTVLLMFSRPWDARNTPETKVYEDIPEWSEAVIDEETGEVLEPPVIIWGERFDRTIPNDDLLPTSVSPYDEEVIFIGFEIEELPPVPEAPYTPTLQDQVAMLQSTIDFLLTSGGM